MDILIKVVEGIKKVGYDGQVKGKKNQFVFDIIYGKVYIELVLWVLKNVRFQKKKNYFGLKIFKNQYLWVFQFIWYVLFYEYIL